MKRILVVLFMFCTLNICAQEESSYRDVIKQFYMYLCSDKKVTVSEFSKIYAASDSYYEALASQRLNGVFDGFVSEGMEMKIRANANELQSMILMELRKNKSYLTQNEDLIEISKHIDSAYIFDEGWLFFQFMELRFSNGVKIYIEIGKETPHLISRIWISSGDYLYDIIRKSNHVEKLFRPGMINDLDGYVNIRESESAHSLVVGKLMKDEVFYYTPNSHSNWWKVYRMGKYHSEGFIHKSRILEFKDFPEKYKEIVREERGGC